MGRTRQGVGDAHRDIAVLVREIEDRDEGILMERGDPESPATAGKAESCAALGSKKVIRLGKCGNGVGFRISTFLSFDKRLTNPLW